MALDFDGVNDIVSHGDVTGIDSATALTISCYHLCDVLALKAILGKTTATIFCGEFVMAADGKLSANFSSGGGAASGGGTTPSAVIAADGVWRHLAFVYDGAGAADADRLKIYVNGVEQTPLTFGITIPAALDDSGTEPFIVSSRRGTSLFGDQKIANVKIWGAALRPDEIVADVYSYLPARLQNVLLWSPYDTGVVAPDYSGAGFTGTVTEAVQANGPTVLNYGDRVVDARRNTRRNALGQRNRFKRLAPLVPLFQRGV